MSFYTAINCMDGRVQLPVIKYLSIRFKAEHIDSVTEAGPVLYLAERAGSEQTKSILRRTKISINEHKSRGIAVIAHHDCAGNPVDDQLQISQLSPAVNFLAEHFPNVEIIGLWLDSNFSAKEICSTSKTYSM
ncbi:MAG: carbonic anhydrase [Planctomycetota bacterium]